MSNILDYSHPPENNVPTWGEPLAIKSIMPDVLALDEQLIPEPYRDWLADISHRMQTPADFVTVSALVVTASVIGSACGIRPKAFDDWEVIPNIWGACIGRPSVVLKSPSMGEVMRLMDKLQAKYGDDFEQEQKDSEFDELMREGMQKDIKNQIAKVAKGKGKDSVIDPAEVTKLRADYLAASEDDEAPKRRLFKTNETSIQSMTMLQNENPRGLLTFRDELTALLVKWDREDHQDERAYFLEGWNGNGSYTDVKIGRGLTDAKNICISLLGGIQPDKLKRYLYQAQQGSNDGLMQRLQLAVWPDEPKGWKNVDSRPNANAKQYAYNIIEALAGANFIEYGAEQGEHDDRPFFRFSNAGQQVFNDWLINLQTVKIKTEDNPLMVEHLGKFRSLMPSLSLIFHLIEMIEGGPSAPVSDKSARLAVAWCDYLESHARRIYAMSESPEHEAAVKLSEKISTGKLSSPFTTRDLLRKGWHGLKNNADIKAACYILVDENWLNELIKPKPETGRPTAAEFIINPKIFK